MTGDIEATYREKVGDTPEQLDSLTVTKRFISTGALMTVHSIFATTDRHAQPR